MADYGESSYRLDLKEPGALEQVVRTYAQPLIRYAYTLVGSVSLAEEAMEDTMAALFVKGGHFRSAEMLRGWLYKTTRNKAIDQLRRHQREVPQETAEPLVYCMDAEEDAMLRQRNQLVYKCMQKLLPQYREVLQLSYFEGFSVEQICRILRKSVKQVYNLQARAKASLKILLIEEGITHEDLR